MEIYLIKEKEKPGKLIQEYFFIITDKCAYNHKMNYFIDNSILSSEYNHNYYFNLPFKIFTILYSSTLQPFLLGIFGSKYHAIFRVVNFPFPSVLIQYPSSLLHLIRRFRIFWAFFCPLEMCETHWRSKQVSSFSQICR